MLGLDCLQPFGKAADVEDKRAKLRRVESGVEPLARRRP
jgi:hypothetical protein